MKLTASFDYLLNDHKFNENKDKIRFNLTVEFGSGNILSAFTIKLDANGSDQEINQI